MQIPRYPVTVIGKILSFTATVQRLKRRTGRLTEKLPDHLTGKILSVKWSDGPVSQETLVYA